LTCYGGAISSGFEKSDLLIDFAQNRSGFKLIQFPEEVNVDFIMKDPDHAAAQPISNDVIKSVILREYGVNLSRLNPWLLPFCARWELSVPTVPGFRGPLRWPPDRCAV
jgi:hypothetical protein